MIGFNKRSSIEGLVLAAGKSSRFNFKNNVFKKYFLKLNNSNLLCYILVGMIRAGIKKITIVSSKILMRKKFKKILFNNLQHLIPDYKELQIRIVENANPERENGYSLSLGLDSISAKYTLLSMADHIFSKNIYSRILKNYNGHDILLATDPMQSKGYYDLDDATKINGFKSLILNAGKGLSEYNRLDMGVFVLKTNTIRKIGQKLKSQRKKFGVKDIILKATESDLEVRYCDIPDVIWLDVDNFSMYNRLKRLFDKPSKINPFEINEMALKNNLEHNYDELVKFAVDSSSN
ncbi:MAG: NTP transferase domain-containing protein [Candidatus Hodarchaeota archaeon]